MTTLFIGLLALGLLLANAAHTAHELHKEVNHDRD